MATKVLQVGVDTVDDLVEAAAAALLRGNVIVYPTDTIYGVGALASLDAAVKRVFAIKGRDPSKPLPLLVADPQDMVLVAGEVPDIVWELAQHFWPGGLTLVVKRRTGFYSLALADGDTVALRVPDHDLTRSLIRAAGEPLIGTSANRAGGPVPRTAQEAISQIGDAVDLVIDAGACPIGTESTVIDVTTVPPRILREGAISREDIEGVIGRL